MAISLLAPPLPSGPSSSLNSSTRYWFCRPSPSHSSSVTLRATCNSTSFQELSGTEDFYSSLYALFKVSGVSYRPPGTQHYLLDEITFSIPENGLGLIFGRSGSGKTTLLQVLAGLSKPTSGSIHIQSYGNDGSPIQPLQELVPRRVGIVFHFPERYFLGDSVLKEVTFGWPRQAGPRLREQLAFRLQTIFRSVGLEGISLDKDPNSLYGGFKRRLALAIQLVQTPDLLLLDEPLAGLDWRARPDVVKLLKHLKKEVTLLEVSHDLKYVHLEA